MLTTYTELDFDQAIAALCSGKCVEYEVNAECDLPYWREVDTALPLQEFLKLQNHNFRQTEKVIQVGKHTIKAPLKYPPAEGTRYFVPELNDPDTLCYYGTWHDSRVQRTLLERGLVHLNADDATAHAKAMIALTLGITR